jgi:hypothetical protein
MKLNLCHICSGYLLFTVLYTFSDMRIQVTNIKTSDTFELNGHQAPILGLSLDPKEEFIVCIYVIY